MGLVGADYFASAVGPAFEVFAQYAKVVRLSGDEVDVADLMVLGTAGRRSPGHGTASWRRVNIGSRPSVPALSDVAMGIWDEPFRLTRHTSWNAPSMSTCSSLEGPTGLAVRLRRRVLAPRSGGSPGFEARAATPRSWMFFTRRACCGTPVDAGNSNLLADTGTPMTGRSGLWPGRLPRC